MISKPVQIIDLNLIDYNKAFELQKTIVEKRINGDIEHDTILILEHPSVFTLGKRGGMENLVVSQQFLESKNIAVIQTERGGNITYHGPGQLVLYPIVNLEQRKIGVSDFVYALEEVMIKTSSTFGVTAIRDKKNHGIWVSNPYDGKNSKMGSIGLCVKHGVSFHGLALNVDLDLAPFNWINPCGMAGISMTSLENERKRNLQGVDIEQSLEIENVKEKILYYFQQIVF